MRLSELQRTTLAIAYRNRKAEGRDGTGTKGADAYKHEILSAYYGWETDRFIRKLDGTTETWGPREHLGRHRFSPSKIGEREYESAHASVARSMQRLEDRGLVTRLVGRVSCWSGVDLTDEGVDVVERLGLGSVEQPPNQDASG